jgi:hypothetical protein
MTVGKLRNLVASSLFSAILILVMRVRELEI